MAVSEQFILEHIGEAIEKGRVRAYFQPIIRTLTDRVCCAEALARWDEPGVGLLSPADFIPVLERHGLIYRLDMAILRDACAMYRQLRDTRTPVHSFSVNFSRYDFEVPGFFDEVAGALDAHGVPHEAISIEVTESVMLEDRERFRAVFDAFHGAGFKIWIDDFGSGYSSLGLLQEFDFDVLKIDMLFIQNFTLRSRQLIASFVNTGKMLGIHTLIEGVETEAQRRFVRSIGCEAIQGFYYARPMDPAAFAAYLTPEGVEPDAEKEYWNAVGGFNLLSPNPMENRGAEAAFHGDIPLALIECTWGRGDYVFANDAYMDSVHSLGFDTIQDLEHFFNARLSARYNPMQRMLTEAVMSDTPQEMDYVSGEVFYKFRAKCITRSHALKKAMVAASLSTFKDDAASREKNDLAQYARSLYASYEHVTLMFPEKDASTRVFSRANFQTAHQMLRLRDGVRSFAEKEVHPDDRERYLRFMDIDSLDARIDGSENDFIQQGFRIADLGNGYRWRQVRVTRVPSVLETIYLYTIQSMSDVSIRIAEMLVREHPELLE